MTRTHVAVVGLGYTGLPLALAATAAGHEVTGFDIDKEKVDQLLEGESYIEDVTGRDVSAALESGFVPLSDPDELVDASVVVISVPTPLDTNNVPDLDPILAAGLDVGRSLRRGDLVILQSTTYPGTTAEVLAPLLMEASGLEVGSDFLLAYAPERIDPGNPTWKLQNTPRIVGGVDEASLDAAAGFLATICETVVRVGSCEVAEAAKLLENTYRHVNIALANEFALLCRSLGIDALAVIDAASTKPFGFHSFRPGPGVGGHCIPVDPHYLTFRARQAGFAWRLVNVAEEINHSMPGHVARRAIECLNERGIAPSTARVLLVGVAYKPGVADTRGTPAVAIAEQLGDLGADVRFADPHVSQLSGLERVDDEVEAAEASDLVIVVTPHDELALADVVAAAPLVLDTRGVVADGAHVRRL